MQNQEHSEPRMEWRNVEKFYEELDIDGYHSASQLRLVRQLISSEYADYFFPTLSHGQLCLSSAARYGEQRDLPMIVIKHLGNGRLQIGYRAQRSFKISTVDFDASDPELWSQL